MSLLLCFPLCLHNFYGKSTDIWISILLQVSFHTFQDFLSFFSHNSSLQQFYKGWFKDYFQKILTSLLPINVIFPIHFRAACFLIYEVFILKLVRLRNLANFIKFSLSLLLQSPSCDIAPVEDKTATHQLPSRIRSPSSPLNHHWPLKERLHFSVWPEWGSELPTGLHWYLPGRGCCLVTHHVTSTAPWMVLWGWEWSQSWLLASSEYASKKGKKCHIQSSGYRSIGFLFFIYICTVLVGTGPQDYSVLFGRHKIVFVHVSCLPS